MDDELLSGRFQLTPEQYRERVKLVRMQAAAFKSRLRRQELLDIARQHEDLADSIERARLH